MEIILRGKKIKWKYILTEKGRHQKMKIQQKGRRKYKLFVIFNYHSKKKNDDLEHLEKL